MRVLLLIVFATSLWSCNDEDFSTGADFFDGVSFEFTSWDTITMNLSTIRFDSVVTSYPTRILAGNLSSDILGRSYAHGYLQLTPDSTTFVLDEDNTRYDSITLVLNYDHYFLGDTTKRMTINIHEVVEDIEADDETFSLYNGSSFAVSDEPLGSTEFTPRPYTGNPVEITLSDELGQKLYNEALRSDNIYTSQTDFIDFLKGIRISTSDDSEEILGFDVGAELRVYYSDLSLIPSEQNYLSFSNNQVGELYFNHYYNDLAGTLLEGLSYEEAIPSSASNDQAYLQSGSGIAIRLELPYISHIIEDNPDLLFDDVTLRLRPINGQYPSDRQLLSQLQVYYVDKRNDIIGSASNLMQLTLDEEFDIDTYYEIDITEFVEYQLDQDENNENALLIMGAAETLSSSAHYLVVGNQSNKEYRAEINLNLIQLKND